MLDRHLTAPVSPLIRVMTPLLPGTVLPGLMPPTSRSIFVSPAARLGVAKSLGVGLGRAIHPRNSLALSVFRRPFATSLRKPRPAPTPLETLARFVGQRMIHGASHLMASGNGGSRGVSSLTHANSAAAISGVLDNPPLVSFSHQTFSPALAASHVTVHNTMTLEPRDTMDDANDGNATASNTANANDASAQPILQQAASHGATFVMPQREAFEPRDTASAFVSHQGESSVPFSESDDTAGLPIFTPVADDFFGSNAELDSPVGNTRHDTGAEAAQIAFTPSVQTFVPFSRVSQTGVSAQVSPKSHTSILPSEAGLDSDAVLTSVVVRTAASNTAPVTSVPADQNISASNRNTSANPTVDLRSARPAFASISSDAEPDSLHRVVAVSASSSDSEGNPESDDSQNPDQQ